MGSLIGKIGGKSIIGTLGSGHIVMGKNVIPDWNQNDPQAEDYIKNRPGGYDVPPTVDISWDGDMTGKEKVQMVEGAYFVKIANEAPTFESFNADKAFLEIETIYGDETTSSESVETTISLYESGDAYAIGDAVLGVSSDYFENSSGVFSKGLWFARMERAEKILFVKRIVSSDCAVKIPVKYMPNDITAGIREAQSAANGAFRIYQNTKDATISIPELRESTSSATLIGDANIAYGSIVTISNSNYSGSAIWNGSFVSIRTKTSSGVKGPLIILELKPSGKYEIQNVTYGTIFAKSTLAYKKVVVPKVTYSILDGAWLPPYTVCSHLYIAGQTSGTAPHTIYKMTVDDTGVPSFTDTGDATNKFTPVTPSELAEKQDVLTDADKQSITKTGMTSGAAWTAAEQKAARERMGIPGNAELLHSITVGEGGVKQVNIPAFPELSRIIVGVIIPQIDAQFPLFLAAYIDDGSNSYIAGTYYGLPSVISSVRFEIKIDAGIVYAESSGSGRGLGGANIIGANNAGEFITGTAITGAYFYTTADSHIPEGTTFNVYGVKK